MKNQGCGLPTESRTTLVVVTMLEDEDEAKKPRDTQYLGKNLEP